MNSYQLSVTSVPTSYAQGYGGGGFCGDGICTEDCSTCTIDCGFCPANTPTPTTPGAPTNTPTNTPTPTNPGGGGFTCGGGPCAGNGDCASGLICTNFACTGSACCLGGCNQWNGLQCTDQDSLCSGGQLCSSGVCVAPSDTPTPTVTDTPTPSPTTPPICGSSCARTGTCPANYTCDAGTRLCVATACPSDPACGCLAPSNTPTPTPTGGAGSCSATCAGSRDCTGGLTCNNFQCGGAACCTGCKTWNGVSLTCVDTDASCSGTQICTAGSCVNPTNTPTLTPTNTSTPTPTNPILSCNAACSGDGDCASNHCFNLQCRAVACETEATCVCPTNTPTATNAPPPPVCLGGLNASNITINAGGTSNLSVSGCTNVPNPTPPTYVWPTPPNGGTTTNVDNPSTTYTGPNNICNVVTDTASVQVCNQGSCNIYTKDITVNPNYSVTGKVYLDTNANNCATLTPSSGITVTTIDSGNGSTLGSSTSQADGSYSVSSLACGTANLNITSSSSYRLTRVNVDSGGFSSAGISGNSYNSVTFPSSHTVDICVSPYTPWFQTTTGDVRANSLTNSVPTGQYASTDATNPSLFIGNTSNVSFVGGGASSKGWSISNEYAKNAKSVGNLGSFAYSYYVSKASQNGVTISNLPNCDSTACALNNLDDGIYQVNGPIKITSFTFKPNAHVVILVNGATTIATTITVPQGQCAGTKCNLFILASKGDIHIDKDLGTTENSATISLEGFISSEGSIILDNKGGCPVADNRINIAGALIANAANPFSQTGSGSIQNNRSLCTGDDTYPTYTVTTRPDFMLQLTDFYKAASSKWQEVQP